MKIIVGLGNPGNQYISTRHNVGFEAIDYIADEYGICLNEKKFKAIYGKGIINNERVILVKPQTYMNLSGESLRMILDFYKVETKDIIIVFDDISLNLGQLRIRLKGSAGGHNGIKSIISAIGTNEFARIKIGIGENRTYHDLADYVLGKFSDEEKNIMDMAYKAVSKAVYKMIDDVNSAMNIYNKRIDNEHI